jgi:hypothetical protein
MGQLDSTCRAPPKLLDPGPRHVFVTRAADERKREDESVRFVVAQRAVLRVLVLPRRVPQAQVDDLVVAAQYFEFESKS